MKIRGSLRSGKPAKSPTNLSSCAAASSPSECRLRRWASEAGRVRRAWADASMLFGQKRRRARRWWKRRRARAMISRSRLGRVSGASGRAADGGSCGGCGRCGRPLRDWGKRRTVGRAANTAVAGVRDSLVRACGGFAAAFGGAWERGGRRGVRGVRPLRAWHARAGRSGGSLHCPLNS
jgi:hypothetical protein